MENKPSPKAVAAKLVGLSATVYRVDEEPLRTYCPYCGLETKLTDSQVEEQVFDCECGAPVFIKKVVRANRISEDNEDVL